MAVASELSKKLTVLGSRLTDKQRKFCHEYIRDFNVQRSARDAGYAATTAKVDSYQMLKQDKIQEYIQALTEKTREKVHLDGSDILRRILRVVETAQEEGDHNAALRGLELLGKHLALFKDRSEAEITVKNPFATGQDEVALARDIERLAMIAGPNLKIVSGGKDN